MFDTYLAGQALTDKTLALLHRCAIVGKTQSLDVRMGVNPPVS
jgi:hypothetical protein